MMFVDLLHTWIASERGGTEQTRKLSSDGGLGQLGHRTAGVQSPSRACPKGRKPPASTGGFLYPATTDQRFVKTVIAGLFAVTLEVMSPRNAMV